MLVRTIVRGGSARALTFGVDGDLGAQRRVGGEDRAEDLLGLPVLVRARGVHEELARLGPLPRHGVRGVRLQTRAARSSSHAPRHFYG